MVLFSGEIDAMTDDKGRLTLPSALNHIIELGPYATLAGPNVLALWPSAEFEKQAAEFKARESSGPEGLSQLRAFTGNANPIKFDGQRRATIPENLRRRWGVGPKTPIVYVGVFDRIEVWDARAYEIENPRPQPDGANGFQPDAASEPLPEGARA